MSDEMREQYEAKWHSLIERFNAVVEETFDVETEHPVLVIGAQWGDIGKDTEEGKQLPTCLVTSNLPICLTVDAIEDMLDRAHFEHSRYHGEDGAGAPTEAMDPESVPEEVRRQAEEMAERFGVPVESIKYVQTVDTSDLEDPMAALNIPLPGDPTGVEGTDAE